MLGHIFADSPLHHGALITASAPAVIRFYKGKSDADIDNKIEQICKAMRLPAGTDLATGITALNTRIGLPSSVRELGYPNDDLDELSGHAENIHFNFTAPIRPTRDEYREIFADALG